MNTDVVFLTERQIAAKGRVILLVLDQFGFGGEWQISKLFQRLNLCKAGVREFGSVKFIRWQDRVKHPTQTLQLFILDLLARTYRFHEILCFSRGSALMKFSIARKQLQGRPDPKQRAREFSFSLWEKAGMRAYAPSRALTLNPLPVGG